MCAFSWTRAPRIRGRYFQLSFVLCVVPAAPVVSVRLAPDSQVTVPAPSLMMNLYSTAVVAGSATVACQVPRVPLPEIRVIAIAAAGFQVASAAMLPTTKTFWPKLVSAASLNVTETVLGGAATSSRAPAWIAAAPNAATVMLASTPENLRADVPDLVWILIFLGLGAVWVAAGPVLTRTPVAALVVGLGDLVIAGWVASEHTVYEPNAYIGSQQQWGDRVVAPLGYAVLAMLTILGVALYLRGRAWPWLTAATVSAAVLVFQMAGDAFGPAVASLVVGTLLLAASGLLIVRRGRAESQQVRDPAP